VNPSKWPNDLDLLIEKLITLPPLSFFREPLEYHENFFSKALIFIKETVSAINTTEEHEKIKTLTKNLVDATKAIFLIYILSGNFINMVNNKFIFNKIFAYIFFFNS
jgi:hypothetical protein